MRDEMVWAYKQGFSLIPLKENSKRPAVEWADFINERPSDEQYREWKQAGLFKTGYGIVTGAVSGITVLDVDFKNGGMESLAEKDISILDILTWTVNSPNGRHYYFKYDKRARQGTARLGSGVDIRNDGGFVVGPGSTVEGKRYEWAFEYSPDDVLLSDSPSWLLQGPGNRIDKTLTSFEEPIRNGERNNKLTSLAGLLYLKQMPDGVVRGVLEYINDNYTDTPIPDDELGRILASVKRYHNDAQH